MSEARLTLYGSPQPTRTARARWGAEELGVDYEFSPVDIFAGAHKRPDYLAVNPLGIVPTLMVHEGGTDSPMLESAAMVLHLAFENPELGLLPEAGTPEFRDVLQWTVFAPAELDRLLAQCNVQMLFTPPAQRNPDVLAATLEALGRRLTLVSNALGESDYLVGDRFSVADVVIGHAVVWARMLDLLGDYPKLRSYLDRLESRPAFLSVYGGPIQTFPDPHAA